MSCALLELLLVSTGLGWQAYEFSLVSSLSLVVLSHISEWDSHKEILNERNVSFGWYCSVLRLETKRVQM